MQIYLVAASEIRDLSVMYEKHNNEPMVNITMNPWAIIQQWGSDWAVLFFLAALALALAALWFLGEYD